MRHGLQTWQSRRRHRGATRELLTSALDTLQHLVSAYSRSTASNQLFSASTHPYATIVDQRQPKTIGTRSSSREVTRQLTRRRPSRLQRLVNDSAHPLRLASCCCSSTAARRTRSIRDTPRDIPNVVHGTSRHSTAAAARHRRRHLHQHPLKATSSRDIRIRSNQQHTFLIIPGVEHITSQPPNSRRFRGRPPRNRRAASSFNLH